MKRNMKIMTLASLFFFVFASNSISHKELRTVKADGEWQNIDTKALAQEAVYKLDAAANDAYIYFTLETNDYSSMANTFHHAQTTTNYQTSDYNFKTYIQFSKDNSNYVPLSTFYRDFNYFYKNGRFRLGLIGNDATLLAEYKEYKFIKVLQGCEFPVYSYCTNGGTKQKYVQKDTTISKLSSYSEQDWGTGPCGYCQYREQVPKNPVTFTGIAYGWNNANYGDANYNDLILQFGEYEVDYLANDHQRNSTNQATEYFDVGTKLTINGLPIYKIQEKYPSTKVSYDHGYCFFYVHYPIDVTKLAPNYLVPTLHIEAGTEFMDSALPEVTLKLVGGSWVTENYDTFTLDNPLDIDYYTFPGVTYPHSCDGDSHAVLANLPTGGCELAFNVNFGEIDRETNDSFHIAGINGITVALYPMASAIFLVDSQNEGAIVYELYGIYFASNYDYRIEIKVTCDETTNIKFAIDHNLLIDYTFDYNKSGDSNLWILDTSSRAVMDYYEELPSYRASIVYGGSSVYDFIEGDPIYNFTNVASAIDLYNDNITSANLIYTYEDGAVTDNKYNEGTWNLVISIDVDGYRDISKAVTIRVHGKNSIARVYFGDANPINVPIGSKLTPPANPDTYHDAEYDYVFDGWYYQGMRWDFENDVVKGDMHLEARFKQTTRHYIVTVNFEGVERESTTYSITKGSSLPFVLFEIEGATFEVYSGDTKISSLVVQDDITITVKYSVVFRYVEAKEATCTEDGNVGYWYSEVYAGYYFADSKGRELIPDAIIPKLNHHLVHLNYQDSSCHEVGHVDCYYCENCDKHYSDANAEHELIDWAIAKKPHVLTHHNGLPPSCERDGYVEYWTCANEPGTYYGDEDCSIVLETILVPATGHDYRNPTYTWIKTDTGYDCRAAIRCTHCNREFSETKTATKVVVRESTCSREGQIAYSVRFADERFNAQNKLVNMEKAPHNYVHVDEIKATKDNDGVKEHYECSECHKYFVKSGERYLEVEYIELVYKYQKQSAGCGGSITATSLMLFISAGALSVLLMLKRKEDR